LWTNDELKPACDIFDDNMGAKLWLEWLAIGVAPTSAHQKLMKSAGAKKVTPRLLKAEVALDDRFGMSERELVLNILYEE